LQLRDYWQVIQKRWWLILLVAVVATAASIGFSYSQQRIYRATVKIIVSPSRGAEYGQTLAIENLLRQYSQQIQTDRMASVVNRTLALDLPIDTLRGKLRVSAVTEDMLIQMEIDDTDPNRAMDIGYTWADQFVKSHQIRMSQLNPSDRIEVDLLDRPRPGVLNYPKIQQFAMAALILGLVVGLLLSFLLEYFDDTLKTPEDVERYVGLSVLSAIPMTTVSRKQGPRTRRNTGQANDRRRQTGGFGVSTKT
jgi:capsular polysaccharide biosynthesis protein